MIGILAGKVKDLTLKGLSVEDIQTGDIHICQCSPELLETLEIGETGVFSILFQAGNMHIRRLEMRKFLDPLYEEDVITASGKFTFVEIEDDPFPRIFSQLKEEMSNLLNEHGETREEERAVMQKVMASFAVKQENKV